MQNVKNTIVDRLLGTLAPHLCYGCQKTGSLLCSSCFYDITNEHTLGCIVCDRSTRSGVCPGHYLPYSRAWCAGQREGIVQRMIGDFKFNNVLEAYIHMARLLDATVPSLPARTVVIPIPTIAPHIRQRGYDHMKLVADEFARMRGYSVAPVLRRKTQTSQRRARTKQERQIWAAHAFEVTSGSMTDKSAPHLLLDDVFTTGATVECAARVLRAAGTDDVWVAVIARQPLD